MLNKNQNNEDLNYYRWLYEPDNVSIKLDQKFRQIIFKKALRKVKSMTDLAKSIQLSKQTLFNHRYGKSMNVKGLKVLLHFIGIDLLQAEEQVIGISENKIKLPIKLNTQESAILFAAILGDGSNSTRVMYKNKDKTLLDKIAMNTKKCLGDVNVPYSISAKGIPYISLPRITGRILDYVGVPYGKQTNQNPGIPVVIMNSKTSVKKEFIKQFFDDEGWVEPDQMRVALSQCNTCRLPEEFGESIKNKGVVYINEIPAAIKDKIQPPHLLVDLQDILKNEFNIHSNLRFKRLLIRKKHITAAFELEIQRKQEVRKFYEKINFSSPTKKKRLEFLINRDRNFPSNISLLIINEAIKLAKEKGFFVAHELARSLGFPQPPIRKRLTTLVKKGIFDKKKEKFLVNIKLD